MLIHKRMQHHLLSGGGGAVSQRPRCSLERQLCVGTAGEPQAAESFSSSSSSSSPSSASIAARRRGKPRR